MSAPDGATSSVRGAGAAGAAKLADEVLAGRPRAIGRAITEIERGSELGCESIQVFNQSPPFEDVNLFTSDPALVEAVSREGGGHAAKRLSAFGATTALPYRA